MRKNSARDSRSRDVVVAIREGCLGVLRIYYLRFALIFKRQTDKHQEDQTTINFFVLGDRAFSLLLDKRKLPQIASWHVHTV